MLELHEFLSEIKASPEFRAAVFRAAVASGYDPKAGDESIAEELEGRITVLIGQILFELSDETYRDRTHNRRKLYDEGCKGPLCLKAERDRSRKRYQKGNPGASRNRRKSQIDDAVLNYICEQYMQRINNNPDLKGVA
jgi:hypothetical protein